MKFFKSLSILAVSIISTIILTSSSCGGDCLASFITFDPAVTNIIVTPGQVYNFTINVRCNSDNIKSINVSKTLNGVSNPIFISIPNVGDQEKSILLSDSFPMASSYGSIITYTVTAISDCKDAVAETATMTVSIGPSDIPIDSNREIMNTMFPRVYSRFCSTVNGNSSWDLQGKLPMQSSDDNTKKDIRDSIPSASPFNSSTVRWGSRNGSKFVKAAATFDYALASPKTIIDAYDAGTPSDVINFNINDCILVNIKNKNTYAAVVIRDIVDSTSIDNDFTKFKYKLAQ